MQVIVALIPIHHVIAATSFEGVLAKEAENAVVATGAIDATPAPERMKCGHDRFL